MLLGWYTSKAKSGLVCPVIQPNCPCNLTLDYQFLLYTVSHLSGFFYRLI